MHFTSKAIVSLALVLPGLAATVKKKDPSLCGAKSFPNCPSVQVCIQPSPNVDCSLYKTDKCPGTCQPACSLTSSDLPCPYGQKCQALPQPSIMQTGFCPDPVFCGGFGNIQCQGADEICVDDPRDDCNPNNGGADCGGICVVNPQRLCDSRGLPPCYAGETCVHDPNSGCGAAQDCPGVCTPQKLCGTLSGLQCGKGEKCVDDVNNTDCTGGLAADCPGVCVRA